MIETTEIDRIKHQVAITSVLASRGIQPDHRNRDELLYHSPFRADADPSFSVNIQENVFKDLVVKECRGDVIRLVMLLDTAGFATAIKTLQDFEGQTGQFPSFFLSGSLESPVNSISKDRIQEVKLLNKATLLRYVEGRGISSSIARKYLREVYYINNGRYLYAVGFPNDSDGYALRNGVGCKRNIGYSDISTVAGTRPDRQQCSIFEGFFDFLSALEYYQLGVPTHTTYILNSTSNVNRVSPHLSEYRRINTYFDRDKAGRDTFETLIQANLPVFDRSPLYQGHKDFNEFFQYNLAK